MDHLIGQRFSLISKSEIRYVGTLHEINPEQSTIALEEVFSFGTEDRTVENFIPPSQQKFEYIVFRGSDVKDIKIAEEQSENKPPSPPPPPNDPAILNSTRPGPPQGPPQGPPPHERRESPYPPPGFPPQGQFNGYYPPHPQFGRGYGPPPLHGGFGPGPGYGHPFPPPPPGYYGPPGQGFPQGPNQFPQQQQQQAPPPIGPPGQPQQSPSTAPQPPVPAQSSKQTQELPVEKSAAKDGSQTPIPGTIPPAPAAVAQAVNAGTSQPPPKSFAQTAAAAAPIPAPAQPKGSRVTPAMPLAVNQKSFTPPVTSAAPPTNGAAKPVTTQTSMEEASRQAKEAVAAAMAKLNPQAGVSKPAIPDSSVDAIAKKVSELSTGSAPARGRGGYRGVRGVRSNSGGQARKVEIPKSDFDFESANAKFNKEDLIKEAIASGSPLAENPENSLNGEVMTESSEITGRKDSASQVSGYNKSSSFFDNISSEARDREEAGGDVRQHARTLRGQEFKKNIETFGQGNVDSGYRGRGRGRGYSGRGYRGGFNNSRGFRGGDGYRGRGRGGNQQAQQAESTAM